MQTLTVFDKIMDISYLLISGFKNLFFDGVDRDKLYDMYVRSNQDVKETTERQIYFQEKLSGFETRLEKIENKVEDLNASVLQLATAVNNHAEIIEELDNEVGEIVNNKCQCDYIKD